MNSLEVLLQRIALDLSELEVSWALLGGLAVSAWTEPRFTRDIDVAVAVAGDDEAEALVRHLRIRNYELRVSIEQDAVGRLASVRLGPPGGDLQGVVVDLLFASSGIEPEMARAAQQIEVFPGTVVPVARLGHLLALKLLSRDDVTRPQDGIDIRGLAAEMDDAERARASEAVRLIETRGYARGRNLSAMLQAQLA